MKEINKSRLIELYNTLDNDELCKLLEISLPTLMALLKENRIPLKGKRIGGLKRRKIRVKDDMNDLDKSVI